MDIHDRRTLTLVLVEDNPAHARLVQLSLEKAGQPFELRLLTDGQAGLEYLQGLAPGTLPDLVILDLRLPRLDGLEILRDLRGQEPFRDLPVVILTTSDREPDLALGYELKVLEYLVKPADFHRLAGLLKDIAESKGSESIDSQINRL